MAGGIGKELAELGEQVALVLEQLGHLAVHLLLRQVLHARADARRVLQIALLLLVGVEDLEEPLVFLGLTLEAVLGKKMVEWT